MQSALNRHRNVWAQQAFLKALQRTDQKVHDWFVGETECEHIPEILCIVDEAGKDMEFVRGMGSSAEPFFVTRSMGKIRLVLCGTHLDSIKRDASSECFVGADPSKSLVVMMQTTRLDALIPFIDPSLASAVRSGIYSRILGTNVSILTKILLPFLDSKFVGFRNSAHQKLIGSTWCSMACVPTAYFNLNGLADLSLKEGDALLVHAFKFFAMKSLSSADTRD